MQSSTARASYRRAGEATFTRDAAESTARLSLQRIPAHRADAERHSPLHALSCIRRPSSAYHAPEEGELVRISRG